MRGSGLFERDQFELSNYGPVPIDTLFRVLIFWTPDIRLDSCSERAVALEEVPYLKASPKQ